VIRGKERMKEEAAKRMKEEGRIRKAEGIAECGMRIVDF
jgi:hypothetical protein